MGIVCSSSLLIALCAACFCDICFNCFAVIHESQSMDKMGNLCYYMNMHFQNLLLWIVFMLPVFIVSIMSFQS
eukprot:c47764_g1_i1 orf=55-273(+)